MFFSFSLLSLNLFSAMVGDLLKVLEETARKHGTSPTRTRLEPELGPLHQHWYDQFAGTWTAEEAAEFDAALAEQRRMDPEIWS